MPMGKETSTSDFGYTDRCPRPCIFVTAEKLATDRFEIITDALSQELETVLTGGRRFDDWWHTDRLTLEDSSGNLEYQLLQPLAAHYLCCNAQPLSESWSADGRGMCV